MGTHYKNNLDFILDNYEVVGYIDKNVQQSDLDKIDITELKEIPNDTKIMITSVKYFVEMLNELLNYGIDMKSIIYLDNEIARKRPKDVYYSYSQFGEDYIISTLLEEVNCSEIKYLEMGVDNPISGDNTFNLELIGAKGWLVEANTEVIPSIQLCRTNCTIINKVVVPESDKGKHVKFYISNINGLSSIYPKSIFDNGGSIIREIDVESISLQEVLQLTGKVNVLSIDLEGVDKELLLETTFDEQYGPDIICAETRETDSEIIAHMKKQNYQLVYLNGVNSIWKKQN